MSQPNDIAGHIEAIYARVAEGERRARNRKRTGVVDEIDLAKGLARVKLGDTMRTAWIPWQEIAAGGIKSHIPPTVGQQVDVLSENGDLTDAVINMSTPSNANPRPHNGPEAVLVMGNTRIEIAGGQATVTSPIVLVVSGDVRLGGSGGKPVARIGDMVAVGSGSSAGNWPIVEGSGTVTAVD